MKKNFVLLLAGIVILSGVAISIAAQSGAGKPVPRLPNGKPDFTGVWDHPRVGDISKDVSGKCAGETPGCKNTGAGGLAVTPLGKAQNEKKDKVDYGSRCLPSGHVRSYGSPDPHAST